MELLEDKLYHKITNLSDLIEEYDAFLFDIWGVLHEGSELYQGIVELFNKIASKKDVRIITNAPRLRDTVADNLKDKGLEVKKEIIFTSGEIARNLMKESKNYFNIDSPLIHHIGIENNTELLDGLNLKHTEKISEADLILFSAYRNKNEDHSSIIKSLELAAAYGKTVLCANPDIEVMDLGGIRFCAGYFARIYEDLGGKVIYSGKPENIIFEECLGSFDSKGKKILMIGDTFETDIRGAHNCNIDSALVLAGTMGRIISQLGTLDKLEAANKICVKQNYLPTHLVDMR